MDKTVMSEWNTLEAHPVYKKVINRKRFFAHTEVDLEVGDEVTIRESKPYSKKVRWLVINNKKE
jgi:ribosomal protein S17